MRLPPWLHIGLLCLCSWCIRILLWLPGKVFERMEKYENTSTEPSIADRKPTEQQSAENTAEVQPSEGHLLTGPKLYFVLLAVTLSAYLTTLDSSIVATVCPESPASPHLLLLTETPGHTSNHQPVSFPCRRGLVWCCISHINVCFP